MNTSYVLLAIALMAGATYAVRVLPMLLFRKPITNVFVRSFLYYVPYAVLTAMTIPAVFFSGPSFLAVLMGVMVAGMVAFQGGSLLKVAILAAFTVYLASLLLPVFL